MDVRDHFIRCLRDLLPAGVDMFEEVEIFRRVHRGDRAEPVIARTKDGAAGIAGTGEQPLDPLRVGVRLRSAARKESLRIVSLLFLGVEGFHAFSISCVFRRSFSGERRKGLAIGGMRAIFRLPGDAETFVEALRGHVLHIHFQP